jgi:hypothetical protein
VTSRVGGSIAGVVAATTVVVVSDVVGAGASDVEVGAGSAVAVGSDGAVVVDSLPHAPTPIASAASTVAERMRGLMTPGSHADAAV